MYHGVLKDYTKEVKIKKMYNDSKTASSSKLKLTIGLLNKK